MPHARLPHPPSRRPGLAVPALFLATLQGDPCELLQFSRGNFICTPPGIEAGPYGTIVSGDLTDDWSPEIAAIQDGTLLVYTNPDSRNQVVEVDQGVLDVCFVPDSNGDSIPELLYTTNDGLKRLQYASLLDRYETDLVDTSAPWAGAKKIRWFEEDVPAEEGVVVVAANGQTFYRCLLGTSGTFTVSEIFALTLAIDPLAQALDVDLLEYDSSNNDLEILLRHAYGFQVRRTDGSIALGRSGNWPNGTVAVVRAPALTDSVAWVAVYPSGASCVRLFNHSFGALDAVPISTRTYGSMAGADVDADGDDDLVLGASHWEELLVLINEPVSQTVPPNPELVWFSNDSERMKPIDMSLGGGTDPVSSMGRVLCGNLYNEWTDAEIPLPSFAIALPEAGGLRLVPNWEAGLEDVEEVSLPNDFTAASYSSVKWRTDDDCEAAASPEVDSRWAMELGNGWGITANATHLQMIVGTSMSNEAPTTYTQATFDLDDLNPLDGTVQGSVFDFVGLEQFDSLERSPVRYFVQVRPVKIMGGVVTRVWRWSILGMSADCAGWEWIKSLAGVKPKQIELVFNVCFDPECDPPQPPPGEPQQIVTRYVPSAVPQSRIPGPGPGVFDWDDQ